MHHRDASQPLPPAFDADAVDVVPTCSDLQRRPGRRSSNARSCHVAPVVADHVDAARQHFEHADLSFAAISRAPIEQIEPVRKRFGWWFAWVSSHGSDFNYDFSVSFTEGQVASGSTRAGGPVPLRFADRHAHLVHNTLTSAGPIAA